jgi:hypothetical protein
MKRKHFGILASILISLLPFLCCSPRQNTQPPPTNSSSPSPDASANKSESVNTNSEIVKEPSSEPSTDALITGQMPIRWAKLQWLQNQKERIIELTLAQDSEWGQIQDESNTSVALLVCYVKNTSPGGAAKVLGDRKFELDGVFAQSVLKPEGGGIDFIFSSGKHISATNQPTPDAIVGIWGSDQLEPQTLKKTKTIHLRMTPSAYAPDVEFKGKGRIAFVLQKPNNSSDPSKGIPVSNIIETHVDFER